MTNAPAILATPVPVDTATIHATIRSGVDTVRQRLVAANPTITQRQLLAGDPFTPAFRDALDLLNMVPNSSDAALALAWALDAAKDRDVFVATRWVATALAATSPHRADQDTAFGAVEDELQRRAERGGLAAETTRFVWVIDGDSVATGTILDFAASRQAASLAGSTVGSVYTAHDGDLVQCRVTAVTTPFDEDQWAQSTITLTCEAAGLSVDTTIRVDGAV